MAYTVPCVLVAVLALATSTLGSVDPRLTPDICEMMEPEMQDALREDLRQNNCLPEVEIVSPDQTERAKRLFHRDGYVVVKDVLTPELIQSVKARMDVLVDEILKRDPRRLGNRGPFRYSFGPPHKTGHILHYPEMAQLVDLPSLTPVLKAIFGNDKYLVRGARGDFNLPGAPYQPIHFDFSTITDPAITEHPNTGRLDIRDLPTYYVVANFVLGDLNELNAPIRQIPMTQQSHRPMPLLDDEPLWMKRSTLCPVPAGSAIVRDPRAWHGGTPNLSDGIRIMPNVEYFAYWYRLHGDGHMTRSMPRDIYDSLSPFGKQLCREVVVHPGDDVDFSMADDIVFLMSDVESCYYHMGVTKEEIEEYKKKGGYFDYTTRDGTPRAGFYGRRNNTEFEYPHVKDEL